MQQKLQGGNEEDEGANNEVGEEGGHDIIDGNRKEINVEEEVQNIIIKKTEKLIEKAFDYVFGESPNNKVKRSWANEI